MFSLGCGACFDSKSSDECCKKGDFSSVNVKQQDNDYASVAPNATFLCQNLGLRYSEH